MSDNKEAPKPVGDVGDLDIGTMQAGDYMIHLFIENLQNLVCEGGDTEVFDALAQIECCGSTQYSTVMKDTRVDSSTATYLGEHFFFEPRSVTSDQIQGAQIKIKVMEKGFLKNREVGAFDIDLAQVYFKNDEHALFFQKIALFNSQSTKPDQIKGFLKISLAIQGPGDSSVKLADEPPGSLEDGAKRDIMMPSSIRKTYKQFNFTFLKAERLARMDFNQSNKWCDPYISMKFLKHTFKTEPAKYNIQKGPKQHSANIDHTFMLPVQWPTSMDRLVMEVKDSDADMLLGGGEDDTLGSIVMSIKDLEKRYFRSTESVQNQDDQNAGGLVWMNIYGAPSSADIFTSSVKRSMNANPELAPIWKGRILVHIEVMDTESPVSLTKKVSPAFYERPMVRSALAPKQYEIIAEVGSGVNLPTDGKYKVRLQIGADSKNADYCVTTKEPLETYHKFNRWSHRFNPQVITTSYQSIAEMDRLYVYLLDAKTDEAVCFWKGKASKFQAKNANHNWYSLLPNDYYGKVESSKDAGLVQFKMSIVPIQQQTIPQNSGIRNTEQSELSQKVDWTKTGRWKKKFARFNKYEKARCFIFQCRNLPAGDADGTSDAFIKAYSVQRDEKAREAQSQTKVCEDNLNPLFYEAVDIEVCYNSTMDQLPPFILDIYDHDFALIGSDADFLGRAIIKANNAAIVDCRGKSSIEIPRPKWHDIRAGNSQQLPPCGQILVSFALCDLDQNWIERPLVNFEPLIQKRQFDVKIHVLGLRDLQSFGIIPVKKPFIKFNVRSLLPPGKSAAVENVRTEPRDIGPNPNMNTLISFSLDLPSDKMFCPKLPCGVYDQICKGLIQPKLGVFDLDIGEIQDKHRRRIKRMEDNAETLIETLTAACEDAIQKRALKSGKLKEEDEESSSSSDGEFDMLHQASESSASKPSEPSQKTDHDVDSELDIQDIRGTIDSRLQDQFKEQEESKADQQAQEPQVDFGNLQTDQRLVTRDMQQVAFESGEQSRVTIQSQIEEKHRETVKTLIQSKVSLKKDQARLICTRQDGSVDIKATFKNLVWNILPYLDQNDIIDREKKKMWLLLLKYTSSETKNANDLKNIIDQIRGEFEMIEAARQEEIRGHTRKLAKINEQLKKTEDEIIAHLTHFQRYNKQVEKERKKKQSGVDAYKEIKKGGREVHRNVLAPHYKFDDKLKCLREINKPPDSMFVEVGYDEPSERKAGSDEICNKHYRKFYEDELENNKMVIRNKPFYTCPIKRGQTRGASTSFMETLLSTGKKDESGFASTQKVVGQFKGYIVVENEERYEAEEQARAETQNKLEALIREIYLHKKGKPIDKNFSISSIVTDNEQRNQLKNYLIQLKIYSSELFAMFTEANMQGTLLKLLKSPRQAIARLYILEGFDFASRDLTSFSDPFMVVRCGSKEYNQRDQYQVDEPNPKIHEVFEFECSFPGAQSLIIEAYDYDMLFGDELIGRSVIDMDDRYFSPEWRSMRNKPIEYRELYHESTSLAQGTVTCWLDIIDRQNKKGNAEANKIWNVKPEPIKKYELRVSVLKCENIEMADVEGTSDVFVKGWLSGDPQLKKETDTHWRCTDGNPDFQYRLLFNVEAPKLTKGANEQAYKLNLFAYDRDILKSNDFLSSFEIDLKPLFDECRSIQKPLQLNSATYKRYFEKIQGFWFDQEDEHSFWLTETSKPEDGSNPARIQLDIRLLPADEAEMTPVGAGRQEPNHSPELPAPAGRMVMSLNPLVMLGQLVGPAFKAYILSRCCCAICIVICVALSPQIIGNVVSEGILIELGLAGGGGGGNTGEV